MPTTTARGLVVPNLAGDGSDLHAMFQALADSIEAMMNSALVLNAAPTAPFFVADSATSAGLSMRDSGATAGLRRSYVINDDGHTYLRHPNDADAAVVNVGWDYNHLTGVVDHPNGLTVGSVAVVGARVFSAYRSAGSLTLAAAATTDIPFDTEEYDTGNIFDPATGRLTPPSGEVWRVSWAVRTTQTSGTLRTELWKAGVVERIGPTAPAAGGSTGAESLGTALVVGDGNYFNIRAYQDTGGSVGVSNNRAHTFVQGDRVG